MDIGVLSNFSVLKSFNDNAQSTLDSLVPFIEYGLSMRASEFIELDELKKIILSDCNIDIPLNTVKTLLKRFKRKNIITEYEGWKIIQLVDQKRINNDKYNQQIVKAQREINQLIYDYKGYFDIEIEDEIIISNFYEFIRLYQKNIDFKEVKLELEDEKLSCDCRKIYKYIQYISTYNDYYYQIFKSIFHGFLLRQFIANNLIDKRIKSLIIYADTNFILRILDMQAPHYVTASRELLLLMKECNIKIVTFPEVIGETKAVINSNMTRYAREKEELIAMYGATIKQQIDGVMGAFFRREMDITGIMEFCNDIEDILKAEGISILENPIAPDISVDQYEYEKILEYKQQKYHINTDDQDYDKQIKYVERKAFLDARILAYIRFKRKILKYNFETCGYVFLTCDNIVYKVNNYNHKKQNSIPECLSESRLTNTLFMCNTKLDNNASIKLLTSIFQISNYLDFDLLQNFHINLKKYATRNPSDQQYLGYIFSNQSLFEEISLANQMLNEEQNDGEQIEEDALFNKLFEQAKSEKEADEEKSKNELKRLKEENEELMKKLEIVLDAEKKQREIDQKAEKVEGSKAIEPSKINGIFKVVVAIIISLSTVISLLIVIPMININQFSESPQIATTNLLWLLIPISIIVLATKIYSKKRIDIISGYIFGTDRKYKISKLLLRIFVDVLAWIVGIAFVILIGVFTNVFSTFLIK